MFLDTNKGDKKVTISTINSIQAKFRKMARNTRAQILLGADQARSSLMNIKQSIQK